MSKIGDVYDSSGNRIGEVRSGSPSSGTSMLVVIGVIGVAIAGIIWVVTAGITSIKNLLVHGEFTTDTQGAEVRDHLDDPNYFAERARASGIALTVVIFDEEKRAILYRIENHSHDTHSVAVDTSNISIKANVDGVTTTLVPKCWSPYIESKYKESVAMSTGGSIEFPANSVTEIMLYVCEDSLGSLSRVSIVEGPKIRLIDYLPVTGGPANTEWKRY